MERWQWSRLCLPVNQVGAISERQAAQDARAGSKGAHMMKAGFPPKCQACDRGWCMLTPKMAEECEYGTSEYMAWHQPTNRRKPRQKDRLAMRTAGSPAGVVAAVPSLVVYGKIPTSSIQVVKIKREMNRQQKSVYGRLRSFLTETLARGCQQIRVDLTTADGGSSECLAEDHQELRKRVKRIFGYDVEHFQVQTREGNGVLHCVWAINNKGAVYIEQEWLADTWQKIHGARVVWIKRLSGELHRKRAAIYLATQYLAGQDALVRMSYSWHKCKIALAKGWRQLRRIYNKMQDTFLMVRAEGQGVDVTFRDLINAWEALLREGAAMLGDFLCVIEDRNVVALF